VTGKVTERKISERSCVACRAKHRRMELLRFVRADGAVVLDDSTRLPGRGAWLCRDLGCFDTAVSQGRLARALRTTIQEDKVATLREDVAVLLAEKE